MLELSINGLTQCVLFWGASVIFVKFIHEAARGLRALLTVSIVHFVNIQFTQLATNGNLDYL